MPKPESQKAWRALADREGRIRGYDERDAADRFLKYDGSPEQLKMAQIRSQIEDMMIEKSAIPKEVWE